VLKRSIGILVILVIVGGGVATWIYLNSQDKPEELSQHKPFRIAIVTWVGFAPFYIALEKGFFEDEGLTVRLERIEDFGARRGALSSGSLEGSVETVDSFAIGIAEGLPAIQVLKIDDSFGGDGLVVRKEINSISGLKGKKVAYSKGSPSHFFLLYFLKKEGMASRDILSQYMEAGEAGAAFVSGKVDAAVTWEPWLSKANETSHGKLLLSSRDYPGLIADTFVVHKSVAEKRPEDVKKVLRAWFRAVQYLGSHREDALAIMSRNLSISQNELEGMLGVIRFPSYEENLRFFEATSGPDSFTEMFRAAGAIWYEEGLIKTIPSPEGHYNVAFLKGLYNGMR
jgi:NitT/TauT family transport system substrate-binding protein